MFEAIRGNDYKGDIAIDEILTLKTDCDILPLKAKYSPDPNGKHVDMEKLKGVENDRNKLALLHL